MDAKIQKKRTIKQRKYLKKKRKSIDMLTIKQITENTEAVIRGLEKKHFKNAKETIENILSCAIMLQLQELQKHIFCLLYLL